MNFPIAVSAPLSLFAMKNIAAIVIAALLVGLLFLKKGQLNSARDQNETLRAVLEKTQIDLAAADEAAAQTESQLKKLEEERGELIKLRGEVSALDRKSVV